jgi:hypothetical protein
MVASFVISTVASRPWASRSNRIWSSFSILCVTVNAGSWLLKNSAARRWASASVSLRVGLLLARLRASLTLARYSAAIRGSLSAALSLTVSQWCGRTRYRESKRSPEVNASGLAKRRTHCGAIG